MVSEKQPFKAENFQKQQAKASTKLRNIFKNKILAPMLIASAMIIINPQIVPSIYAKNQPKKAIIELKIQEDTLKLVPAKKSNPIPKKINDGIVELLSKISHEYPDVVKGWAEGQMFCDQELKIEVYVVNKARFEDMCWENKSVFVEPEFENLYINADAPLDKIELIDGLSWILTRHGGFTETSPFNGSDIASGVMAYSIAKTKIYTNEEEAPYINLKGLIDLWLAQLVGLKEFTLAYARGDPSIFREAYDKKFGAGKYNEIMQIKYGWKGPGYPLEKQQETIEVINKHLRQSGSKETLLDQAIPLAKAIGYKIIIEK